jgi:hypothetical protein
MAQELVDTDLHFKRRVSTVTVDLVIGVANEWNGLFGSFGGQHVAQTDVLEAQVLPDVVVVRNVLEG